MHLYANKGTKPLTHIYGLIDPRNHQVKYVGQSRNPEGRLRSHLALARRGKDGFFGRPAPARREAKPVYLWLRDLHPALPVLVVLEAVERRIIRVNGIRVQWASAMEAKWLKRHRRTVLNYDKKQCAAYDAFVNSREVNEALYAQTGPAC